MLVKDVECHLVLLQQNIDVQYVKRYYVMIVRNIEYHYSIKINAEEYVIVVINREILYQNLEQKEVYIFIYIFIYSFINIFTLTKTIRFQSIG